MTPAEIAIEALRAAASAAPGLLALLTSAPSDADAIERARKALDAVPTHPAADGLDRRAREVA